MKIKEVTFFKPLGETQTFILDSNLREPSGLDESGEMTFRELNVKVSKIIIDINVINIAFTDGRVLLFNGFPYILTMEEEYENT